MKTAAIYCRVSTAGQARDGTSLVTQREACERYAGEQGLAVVKVVEEDASGGRLDRAGLDVIRDLAERGEVDTVIVYDPDRLSRNLGHLMMLVEEFKRNRAELAFVNSPLEDSPEGTMLLQMRGMFAEYERSKFLERTRRGKKKRASEGRVQASWAAPYGYVYIIGEGRFEVVPDEAQWVVRIFEWYVREGASLRTITRRLNDQSVPTKRGVAAWAHPTVRSILVNPTYTGQWFYNKTAVASTRKRRYHDGRPVKREKSTQVLKPRSEWISVQVPAIIPQDLFDGVRAQMERNTVHSKRNCKNEYLLRGFLWCAQCGRRLTAGRSHRTSYGITTARAVPT